MCLAIPGRIIEIAAEPDEGADDGESDLNRVGRVSFDGVVKTVSLAFVPEAKPGDYVIVHVGVALNTVDETEARKTLEYLREIDELTSSSGGA